MARITIIALVKCALIAIIKGQCAVEILSNDHTAGAIGQYFNFDVATADCALASQFTSNGNYKVFYSGDNSFRNVVMWRNPNGGSSGDGHGRQQSGAAAGDWQTGEWIVFVDADASCTCDREISIDDLGCSFEILSNDHTFGDSYIGQYFNFDVSTADCSLGVHFTNNGNYDVFYSGDNSFRNVVMWRSANGGSIGDGHGRQSSGAGAGDWQVGERVAFLGTSGCLCYDPCEYSLEEYVDICYCADDEEGSAAKSPVVRIDYPNDPDQSVDFNGYTFSFSFSNQQFLVLCAINVFFMLIFICLCLFGIKTTKQLKEYQAVKKVDYLSN